MITQEIMNRIVFVLAQQQNEIGKLNAGQLREMVRLVINALGVELAGSTKLKHLQLGDTMPAKKKGAKKAKPASKPMPKKGY